LFYAFSFLTAVVTPTARSTKRPISRNSLLFGTVAAAQKVANFDNRSLPT
jgi:hypothetical protein